MSSYFIESFTIEKLWGYRNIDLTFDSNMNVLIGPNGSGKTTVLTLLHSILSLELSGILNVNFEYAEIHLRDFKDNSVPRTVKVNTANRLLRLWLDKQEVGIDIEPIVGRRLTERWRGIEEGNTVIRRLPQRAIRRGLVPEDFYDELTTLVPIIWLPISRHLPTTVGEEERYTRRNPPESVDSRLPQLLKYGLPRYCAALNARFSEHYREFVRQALSTILYNKEQDQLRSIPLSLPTEVEKEQLVGAFKAAGFLTKKMQDRINDHFDEAKEVIRRLSSKNPDDLKPEDFLMLPLIGRTQIMVKYAKELEEDRTRIFASLRLYEEIVNSFLDDKFIEVDDSGQLKIESSSSSDLNPLLLSSGEKQILILLTEALLRVDEPVVYIADEPELSLHVTWQEKLLESLVTLGGQKQIIVATHSPDIVGKFRDNVITLGKES